MGLESNRYVRKRLTSIRLALAVIDEALTELISEIGDGEKRFGGKDSEENPNFGQN